MLNLRPWGDLARKGAVRMLSYDGWGLVSDEGFHRLMVHRDDMVTGEVDLLTGERKLGLGFERPLFGGGVHE